MERINLNVPADVRKRLRSVARMRGCTEAEAARSLLMGALEEQEREEFYRQAAAAVTPEYTKRQREILDAFERLDG